MQRDYKWKLRIEVALSKSRIDLWGKRTNKEQTNELLHLWRDIWKTNPYGKQKKQLIPQKKKKKKRGWSEQYVGRNYWFKRINKYVTLEYIECKSSYDSFMQRDYKMVKAKLRI
jgi:hypothetical protein